MVYNDFINSCDRSHADTQHVDWNVIGKVVTTQAKKTPERLWLSDVSSVALQQSVQDAIRTYKNWFNGMKKPEGKRHGEAKFKRKSHRNPAGFTRDNHTVRIDGCSNWGFVKLPKIGEVKFRLDGRELGDTSSVTLIHEPRVTNY